MTNTIEIKASTDGYYLCGADSTGQYTPDGPYATEVEAIGDVANYADKCGFAAYTVTQEG